MKGQFLFNRYFGSLIRFAHSMITLGEEFPSLASPDAQSLYFYHSDF